MSLYPGPPHPPRKGAILAIILISYVMIVLDISVVLTGLPKIHQQLGFSEASLAWVQSAYTLTFGGLMLLGARAGDILGRRRMFVSGLAVFIVASLAIGASQSAVWMLSWRAIQGMGAAVLAPSTLALLQIHFGEGHERTRAVSYYAAAAGASATVGLIIGGVLAQWVSWRAGFYINLPVGIGLIVAAYRYIEETPTHTGKFDLLGAITSTLGIGGLVFGFIRSAQNGGSNLATIASLLGAALVLSLFVMIERRAAQPILPLHLFSSRIRSGAYAARVLYLGAMVGFFFFSTLYLQEVKGYGPAASGLAFLPATILHVPFAITGCSSGLGHAIAPAVLDAGFNAIVTARSVDKVKAFERAYPERALTVALDLTDKASIAQTVALAEDHFGPIDVLINNAGYGYRAAVEEGDEEDVANLFATHVFDGAQAQSRP